MRKVLLALPIMIALAGCATTGSVRLNTNKAFLTADTAFLSVQQTTLALCSVPTSATIDRCNKAIDILHDGAKAEAAGFAAQQAGNSTDLASAVTALANIPAQLVALGILKAK